MFDISGYIDIAWGICCLMFTLYILNDESIKPSDVIMGEIIGYQFFLIWIPTAFFILAYIAPDDSARIKAVTSPSISISYHTFNFEPKLQAVREYRKSY